MYDRLGKFAVADKLLTLAVEKSSLAYGSDSLECASALSQQATLLGDEGKVEVARKTAQQALDLLAKRRVPPTAPAMLDAKVTLGRTLVQSGEYDRAIALLTPLAQMKPPYSEEQGRMVRDGLAVLLNPEISLAKFDDAEATKTRLLAMDHAIFGDSHPEYALDGMNAGTIEAMQGRYAEAEPFYRQSIPVLTAWYGADNPDVVTARSILAKTLTMEGKNAEAHSILQNVLSVQEASYGEFHERVAFTLFSLGDIDSKENNLKAAEAEFTRALAIDGKLMGDANPATAMIRSSLGNVYSKEKRYALAETTLRDAAGELSTIAAGNPYVPITRARWGHALLMLKRYPEAKRQLAAARDAYAEMPAPPAKQLQAVRDDLAAAEAAVHRPASADLAASK